MPDDHSATLRGARPLFKRPTAELTDALERYRGILEAVHPLRPKHKAGLPLDVKALSLALTAERGPGPKANYLAYPANLSAYLYYFLPWNLYRMARLLDGLDFDPPEGASVLDLGCGPLTFAQALWIARPDLRRRRLRIVCVDQTGQVLRLGKDLFDALSAEGGHAWSVETVQAPVHMAPHEPFDAVVSLNALNELARGRGEEGHNSLERVAELVSSRLAVGGRTLFVEPGTRLGGKLLSRLREELMELDLWPIGPCTHDEACPMLAPRWRSWCHFVFPADGAPQWLARLSALSGLEKDRLSLSYLSMSTNQPEYTASQARVVSHRFPLPPGQGLYICASGGLRLVSFRGAARGMVSGAVLDMDMPEPTARDPKSGVWLCPLAAGGPEDAGVEAGSAPEQAPKAAPDAPAREGANRPRPQRPGAPGSAKSGPRPGPAAGHGSARTPNSKPGPKPGSKPGPKSGSKSGPTPGADSGSTPAPASGDGQGRKPSGPKPSGPKPSGRPGGSPGPRPKSGPGSRPGNGPGNGPGSGSGKGPGSRPGHGPGRGAGRTPRRGGGK